MIPARIQTLVFTNGSGPSILVLSPIEDNNQTGAVRVLPIWMGTAEAAQLGIALDKIKLIRPMTHDLFLDALTNLDASVDSVVISRVEGQIFYAHLALRSHGRLIDLDARPSDAIALAIRQEAPLYIDESVLEKAAIPYLFKTAKPNEQELEEFHSFIQTIAPEDFQ